MESQAGPASRLLPAVRPSTFLLLPAVTVAAFLLLLLLPASAPPAHAHQVDSVGGYRIQIGWMQEPAVSGEPNGVELYVSPLDPAQALKDQRFADGIPGLQRDLKIQLILAGESTTLPLRADHDTPGKYFALVEPAAPGFYQVNVLGRIGETVVSKSLHAPKVENKEYLRFPQTTGDDQVLAEHEDLRDDVARIQDSIRALELSRQEDAGAGYAGLEVGLATAALAAAAVAVAVAVAVGKRPRR